MMNNHNYDEMQAWAKHKDGTYVALEMQDDSKRELDEFITGHLSLNERTDPNEYHITVTYSTMPVPYAEKYKKQNPNIFCRANAIGYDLFTTKDGGKCLVLRVDCTLAELINKDMSLNGATSNYPEYHPHITICYNYTGDSDVSNLPIPDFHIFFDELTVKPLDLEFVPDNKS